MESAPCQQPDASNKAASTGGQKEDPSFRKANQNCDDAADDEEETGGIPFDRHA